MKFSKGTRVQISGNEMFGVVTEAPTAKNGDIATVQVDDGGPELSSHTSLLTVVGD